MEGTKAHESTADASGGELKARISEAEDLVEQLAARLLAVGIEGVPREDLVAYGQQGLLEAALRFDASRGASFRTFAYYRVRGAMIDGLRKMGIWSRRGWEVVTLMRAADAVNEGVLGEAGEVSPSSPSEAAERLRKHMANMVTAMATGVFCEGAPVAAGDGRGQAPSQDREAVDSRQNAEEELAELQLAQLLRRAVDELPPPEDLVLRSFYVEGHNMEQIAQELGRSRSWVSRIHGRALTRLGSRLRAETRST